MAKRVNIRFLKILTAVVVPAAILVVLSPWIYSKLLHRNPKHWIALGDAALAKNDWQEAVNNFGTALQLDPTNKTVCVSLGDGWYHLTSADPQNIRKAITSWNRALQIDPQYVPALQRLLAMDRQLADLYPTNQDLYGQIRDTARKLAQADPTDAHAKAYVDIATIQQALANGPVTDKDFQKSLAALQAMQQHDPANPDLVLNLARAYIMEGTKALKLGDSDADDNYDKQARSLVESALAIKPNDPALNLRAFQVYAELSGAAHLTEVREAAAASAGVAIANAYAHVEPNDPTYSDIAPLLAQWDIRHGKNADAEAVLRKYNSLFPDDLRSRILFATSLADNFGKRDEAIDLLSQPISDVGEAGPKGEIHRAYKIAVLSTLTGLEIDKCDATTDAAERDKLLAKIQPQIDELMGISPEDPRTLRMKGAVEIMKGQRYEAIETLSKAKHLLEANTNPDSRTYFGVLYQLGGAYMSEGQSASAERSLEQAAQIAPTFVPVHQKLAVLYLQDHNFDLASQHIDAIAKINPNDPQLSRLRLALDQSNQQPEKAKEDYAKLPESTHTDRLVKAQAAAALGNLQEVARLVQSALDQQPNDPQNSLALAGVLHRLNHDDQAVAVLQSQLKLSPNDDRVALLLKQMQNAPTAELKPLEAKVAGGNEFSRAVAAFGQDFNNRKYDAALADLKSAEHAGGNEQLVAELYFQLYLARQQYDDAAAVINTLARLNADDANGLTYQVRLAMARNHRDEAIHAAQNLTGTRPELAMSWIMLGDAYQANGQYDQALQNYRQALDRQSVNPDALAGEINCYIALHDLDTAASTIATARRLFPNSQKFRSAELDYKLTYGNPEEVVAELQKNLAAHPEDRNSYLMLVEACLRTAESRSAGNGDNGPRPFMNMARDVLAKALAAWPNDPQFVPLMAQVEQGSGDFASALKLLNDFAALPQWKNRAEPQLFLADLYNRAGETPETEAALRAAWANDRNDVNVQLRLAQFLGGIGKYDDAFAVLTETSDPSVARERMQLLIDAGRYAEAETSLQAALASAPDNVDLLYLLSVLHADTGHFQDAQSDVRHGLNVDPKNARLMLQSARIELSRPHGDLSLASRQLESLLESAPKDLDAHVMLSDLYARQNQTDAAITEMESAMNAAPLNKPLRVRLAKLYLADAPPQWTQFDQILHEAEASDQLGTDPTWLDLEATGLFKRNQVPDALAKMQQAAAMAPNNSTIERDYISMLLQAKQYDDVIKEIDRAMASGKRYWWLHELRGMALAKKDQKQQATQEFQTALADVDADGQRELAAEIIATIGEQIDPDTALTLLQPRMGTDAGWKLLGIRLDQAKGDTAAALKLAEDVAADPLSTTSQRLAATQAVAECAQQQGQFEKAKSAYLSWLEQSPKDLIALNNLACLLTDNLKQPHEALQYSKQAYTEEASANQNVSPFVSDTHGWVLVSCGGVDAANGVTILQQLVQDHPDFIAAHYHLAEAYLQQGNNDGAMTQLSAASGLIKTQEANHVAVPDDLKKNVDQAMNQARQANTKGEAAIH
jgi:tetratricopeptide (TPR) repeat protein